MYYKKKQENDYSDTEGAVWNIDDAENQLLFQLKQYFLKDMAEWELESAYWKLDLLFTESITLFDEETTQKELKDKMQEVISYRTDYLQYNPPSNEIKAAMFNVLKGFYMKLCQYIVDEGVYFRKKKAYLGL